MGKTGNPGRNLLILPSFARFDIKPTLWYIKRTKGVGCTYLITEYGKATCTRALNPLVAERGNQLFGVNPGGDIG
jgi:hypothetical protein